MSPKQRKPDLKLKRSLSGKDKDPVVSALIENLSHCQKGCGNTPIASLLLAISGGIDSMVLLHALSAFAEQNRIKLYVAHIDHQLRAASKMDAAFVCTASSKLKIPVYLLEAQNPPRTNIERWGRDVRYKFFSSVRQGLHIDAIVTAHTASDDVELFLMQLFSNKSLHPMPFFEERRKIWRPLLSVTRREIREYAQRHSVAWVEDETNASDNYLRNRVRNRLLPLLNNLFDGDVEKTIREQIERIHKLQTAATEGLSTYLALRNSNTFNVPGKNSLDDIQKNDFGTRAWMRSVQEHLKGLNGHSLKLYTEALLYPYIRRRLGDFWPERLKAFFLGNSAQMQLPGSFTIRRKHGGIELTQSDRPTKL